MLTPVSAQLCIIATIPDQESLATNEEFELQITGSMADIPCSSRAAKLSTDAQEFIDQEMGKNGKMKSQ